MVASSGAITLMPQLALRADKNIRCIPFTAPAPSRLIGLFWRKTDARKQLYTSLTTQALLWPLPLR